MTVLEAEFPAPVTPAPSPQPRRTRPRLLRAASTALPVLLVLVGVPACWWIAGHSHPRQALHEGALFLHLAALVVGFGAVLTVDWVGLLWLTGKRTFADVLATAGNVTLPIWAGYTGLVASGLLLEPNLHDRLTQVKIGLVVLIGLNGLVATTLHRELQGGPSLRLVAISSTSAGLSQLGWWGAVVIGHLNTR